MRHNDYYHKLTSIDNHVYTYSISIKILKKWKKEISPENTN